MKLKRDFYRIQLRIGLLIGFCGLIIVAHNALYYFFVYKQDPSFEFMELRRYTLLGISLVGFITTLKDAKILRIVQVFIFYGMGVSYIILNTTGDLGGILFFAFSMLLAYQYLLLRRHYLLKILLYLASVAVAELIAVHLNPNLQMAHGITTVILTIIFFYSINLLFADEIQAYKSNAELFRRQFDENKILIKTGRNLTGIVHNIKSRMTSVLGFNELIREESAELKNPELIEYAKLQHEAISHIITQIQNLLFTVANSQDTEARPVSLNRMLDGTIEMIKSFKDIRHELDISKELTADDTVYISPVYLVEIIENILRNALDAAPEHQENQIYIRSRVQGEFLFISISDCGTGIEELHGRRNIDCLSEDIFKPGKTTKENGSGIGMSSAVDMLKASGGKMFLTTGPEGTQIDLHLPRQKSSLKSTFE